MARIKVLLKDGTEEYFPHYVLDHVIKKKGILAFLRTDGWVYIDRDPVRTNNSTDSIQGFARRISDQTVKKRFTDHIPGDTLFDPPHLRLPKK